MSSLKTDPETGLALRDYGNNLPLQNNTALQKLIQNPKGPNLFSRFYPGEQYIQQFVEKDLWLHNRKLQSGPATEVVVEDDSGTRQFGINFAGNDYLGLSKNSRTVDAAIEAAQSFGVNSAGSPLAFGATKYYMQLKEQLGEHWEGTSLIYSAGWLVNFGVIKGYLREFDHAIIDEFAQNSLQEGVNASTKNSSRFRHLDEEHLASLLKEIRQKDNENAILVITEGLFPGDSEAPNLAHYNQLCKKYNAFLLISCTHDFGIYGATGKGIWQDHINLNDRSKIILTSSGSKVLSVNFGFVGVPDKFAVEYLKYFSSAYMFTNAINPVQAACGLANLRIVRSQQGKILRKQVLSHSEYLRSQLQANGHKVLGVASPFVCIRVSNEIVARLVVRILFDNGIHVNVVEYPAVRVGQANIRVSLQPEHTREQLDTLVRVFGIALKKAREVVDNQRTRRGQQTPKL